MSKSKQSIFKRWDIDEQTISDLIDDNPSLRGMVLGYVAEKKFHDAYLNHNDISSAVKDDDHDRLKKGDRRITYKDKEFLVEVKSLQTKTCKPLEDGSWIGKSQVDGSDKRTIKFNDGSELSTTLLLKGEFDLLAVNCFAFGDEWKFAFAKNSDLPTSKFKKYTEEQRNQLLSSMVEVTWPPQAPFSDNPYELLDEMIKEKEDQQKVDVLDITS